MAGKAATGSPIVTATDPTTAPQDTTLDVQILGSGFDRGSRVDLALDGVVSDKVKTNSTRFVNKSKLIANITIAVDADPDLYDVLVTTTKGKRGIGIELFEITYSMTEIGALPGDDGSIAHSISESGDVVGASGSTIFVWKAGLFEPVGPGYTFAASDNRRIVNDVPPSVWKEVGGSWVETLLPTLSGNIHQATGISTDGTVVLGMSDGIPVIWRESAGSWTIIPLPAASGAARDMNASGMVVGRSGATAGVWTEENGSWSFQALASFPSGASAFAWAINDHGDIVGWSEDHAQGGYQRALLWRRTATGWDPPVDLGSLGGGTWAQGINNSGQVVGTSQLSNDDGLNHTHAFLWTPFDGMIDLGGRDTDNAAYDINDLGQIVGASRKAAGGNFSGEFTAVMWAPDLP